LPVMDQLHKVLNILEVSVSLGGLWIHCVVWLYHQCAGRAFKCGRMCVSRSRHSQGFHDTLLVQADGSEFDVGRDLSVDHYCDSCVLMTCNHWKKF
jgi:hypothetical protein